jgi:hypothetical protein
MKDFLLARWGEATTNHGLIVLAGSILSAVTHTPPLTTPQIAAVAVYGALHILLPEN